MHCGKEFDYVFEGDSLADIVNVAIKVLQVNYRNFFSGIFPGLKAIAKPMAEKTIPSIN